MGDRDSWCTPLWFTRRLPLVDLDPCSNARSTVRARRSIRFGRKGKKGGKTPCGTWEYGNGLITSWRDLSVFVNPPYSDVLPWAIKAREARSFCFLVNEDSSTEWWKVLTEWRCHLFLFRSRIAFDAPPGIDSSQNNSPQAMICDPEFRKSIGEAFKGRGQWWNQE